jgi:hypothetical protein
MTIALPRLDIAETMSPFDEAIIMIDGREEETITIECEGAAELAEKLVRFVNHHREIVGALQAAVNVLRAVEAGPPGEIVAGACELLLKQTGAAA